MLAAAVLLLTGCRKAETYDYTQDYGDYLSYSLGTDYQLKYDRTVYTADGSYCSRWRGQYTHPVLGLRQFTVEAIDNGLELYASKQHWRDCSLLSTLYGEAASIAKQEIKDRILSKYYKTPANDFQLYYKPEYGAEVLCEVYVAPLGQNPDCEKLVRKALDPQDGLRLSTADLKQFAEDPNVIVCFFMTLKADVSDPAVYVNTMEQIRADYLRIAGSPQNYSFFVTQTHQPLYGGEKKEMLYDSAALTGIGEFTVAERYGDCKSIPAEMQEELLGILLKE